MLKFGETPTVEDTLRDMLLRHPDLFRNKAHALNQLFCVNGNGYDWIDGALQDVCSVIPEDGYDYATLVAAHNAEAEKWNLSLAADEARYNFKYEHSIYRRLAPTTEAELQTRLADMTIEYVYSLYDRSDLCCVPDDVRQDWLEAALETVNMILGLNPTASYWDHSRSNLNDMAVALTVKNDLLRRFGARLPQES